MTLRGEFQLVNMGMRTEQVKAVEQLLKKNINLIPIEKWGFDKTILDEMKAHKHRTVDSQLSEGTLSILKNWI